MGKSTVLLADIGNSYFHLFDGQKVEHLHVDEAIEKYKNNTIHYISVNRKKSKEIADMKVWREISNTISIEGEYETMGIDRKALCLSHNEGLFVDAGSAITIDVVENGIYKGGILLPGIKAYLKSYASISDALDVKLNKSVALDKPHTTTKEQISYGIIASIKALIEKHGSNKKLYFTGGDGEFLSTFFDNAIYDETLVFRGMQHALNAK